MFAPKGLGYDRGSTIFSPDGRLFQVEYAIEAVKRGTTAIGIKTSEGCILAVQKRLHTTLIEKEMVKKIFAIDEHIAVAIAGLTADARILVNQARVQAQIHQITYNESITVENLTHRIADVKQAYTQHAGVRPFGVSLIIAGVDEINGPQLFMTEPSGSYWGYRAAAIGSGTPIIVEDLENSYRKISKTLQEGILVALKALQKVSDDKLDPDMVEIAIISSSDRKLNYYNSIDILNLIKQIKNKEE
ncbi:proteasome endopeptidase complex, archaeal, alpha subunit [Candidatus Heimdallarchaeota archaeon B3_Heim]|nr:MAG: proteasome endopeptidase complex, archaeal, alpha subunit [Candidatus Heimdallarchaeota archaeon B3_Heim]